MRPLSISAFGLAAALALTVAPATSAVTPSRDDIGPDRTASLTSSAPTLERSVALTPRAQARATLRNVERAFAGESPGRELTLDLRELRLGLKDLPAEERERARAYLARPTDGDADPWGSGYGAGVVAKDDCTVAPTPGSNICVHWATTGEDAPVGGNGAGLPAYVVQTRDVMNDVFNRIVTQGGYRAPLSDATSPNPGPDTKIDIYLADLGDEGLYGYCTSDDPSQVNYAVSAFCVLDNDYSATQYPMNSPLENLQVTGAHEFFHAVQFAYDAWEDRWLLEGTAAWVEDQLYDDIDDNLQYLADSPLTQPGYPMDYSDDQYWGQYGNWIFWRFLTERYPATDGTGMPVVMRQVFEKMGGPGLDDPASYSTQALAKVVASKGTTFAKVFQQFGVANRRPAKFYDEGSAYPAAPLATKFTIKGTKPWELTGKPMHLTNGTARVTPGSALSAKSWKLKLNVDLPPKAYGYGLAVTSFAKNGSASTKYVSLAKDGDANLAVPFSTKKVKYLELTVTNASIRYNCWQSAESPYACFGFSKDDGRQIKIGLKAVR